MAPSYIPLLLYVFVTCQAPFLPTPLPLSFTFLFYSFTSGGSVDSRKASPIPDSGAGPEFLKPFCPSHLPAAAMGSGMAMWSNLGQANSRSCVLRIEVKVQEEPSQLLKAQNQKIRFLPVANEDQQPVAAGCHFATIREASLRIKTIQKRRQILVGTLTKL